MPRPERPFWVYIMANEGRTLYVGSTSNILARVRQHKAGDIPGFTAKYGLTSLVHFEEAPNAGSAIARERQIKGWLRTKKVRLIEAANPNWDDLSAGWFDAASDGGSNRRDQAAVHVEATDPSLRSG